MAAICDAGLYWVVSFTILVRNVGYAPYNKGMNLSSLWEYAMEMVAAITPDDVWLCKCWPGICADMGWTQSHDTDRDARARFLKSLPGRSPFRKLGPRAAPGKWHSVTKSTLYDRPHSTTMLFGIGFLTIRKGWANCWEDLFLPLKSLEQRRDESMAALGDGGGAALAVLAGSGAASSSGAAVLEVAAAKAAAKARGKAKGKAAAKVAPVIVTKAEAKREAIKKKDQLYSKPQNSLHVVGRLLGNVEFRDLQEVMLVVLGGVYKEHSSCLIDMKSYDGCLRYYSNMYAGAYRIPVYAAIDSLKNLEKLRRVQSLTLWFSQRLRDELTSESPKVVMEDAFCSRHWKPVCSLASERIMIGQQHRVMHPLALAGSFGDDRLRCFSEFKKIGKCTSLRASARFQRWSLRVEDTRLARPSCSIWLVWRAMLIGRCRTCSQPGGEGLRRHRQ